MKKFLCYDTNDAASGKINVDSRGILKPNSTVPSGGEAYKSLVTDGDGNVKWEDRLAYETIGEIKHLDEKTLAFSDAGGNKKRSSFTETLAISVGDTVTVTWDGVPYTCIADDTTGALTFGNMGIIGEGEDTGEPFVFLLDSGRWIVGTTDSSDSHVVSVSSSGVIVKKIDEEYLDISNVSALVKMPSDSWTYEKAKEILDSGKFPYMQMSLDWGAFMMFPCQDATGQTSPAYITFASFVSCGLMDYGHASVAYVKLVKGEGTPNVEDVKIYDLPRSNNGKSIIVKSSTSGSSKQFKITVDDSGAISATEVTP